MQLGQDFSFTSSICHLTETRIVSGVDQAILYVLAPTEAKVMLAFQSFSLEIRSINLWKTNWSCPAKVKLPQDKEAKKYKTSYELHLKDQSGDVLHFSIDKRLFWLNPSDNVPLL